VSFSRPGRKRNAILGAVLAATAGASGQAQESVRPSPGAAAGAATTVAVPSPMPADDTPRAVTASGPSASRARDSAGAAAWKGVQARAITSGQARLALGAGERVIHPGDAVGGDVVRSIEPGRILLGRALPDGGEATVVVAFDEAGHARVRILYGSDPTALRAPAVR
jgi:hypothetical protein